MEGGREGGRAEGGRHTSPCHHSIGTAEVWSETCDTACVT